MSRPCSTLTKERERVDLTQTASATFDAAPWFAEWPDNGGIFVTVGDRLWIGRTPHLDRTAAQSLDMLRGAIMHAEAMMALRGVLRGSIVAEEA